MRRIACTALAFVGLALAAAMPPTAIGQAGGDIQYSGDVGRGITLVVRDSEIREVFEMLARTENVSIAMSEDVEGKVSVSLFEVSVDEAVHAVALSAGLGVDRRDGAYLIVPFDDVGQDTAQGVTEVRSYKIQYSDPEPVREILEKHLSRHGAITAFENRNMVVVEDMPDFLDRVASILEEIDAQPQQILLEAKLLEIGFDKNDTLGVDWSRITEFAGSDITIGVRGLTTGTSPGFFFNIFNENLEGAIEALTDQGRVRTLSAPRLLTVEDQEAEVLVGSRLGYRVTTTINQVTNESVEFIESGVILRFTPSVDRMGRILIDINPEVSSGRIVDGIPEQVTTEVTTQLLVEDGERIFIGGLLNDSTGQNRRGVPLISRIPVLGLLFARSEWNYQSSETIILVRATITNPDGRFEAAPEIEQFDHLEAPLEKRRRRISDRDDPRWKSAARDPSPSELRSIVPPAPQPPPYHERLGGRGLRPWETPP